MDLQAPPAFFRDPLGRLDPCHTCVSYSITTAIHVYQFPVTDGEMHSRKERSEKTHSPQIVCAGFIKPVDCAAYCNCHVVTIVLGLPLVFGREDVQCPQCPQQEVLRIRYDGMIRYDHTRIHNWPLN